jgi:predicted nucleic acid-binding protein
MLYFDTNYLVRVYYPEPGYDEVRKLMERTLTITTGWQTRAEFAAAILRKRRENPTKAELLNSMYCQFVDDCATGFVQIAPLTEDTMLRLESVLATAPTDTFLRAADALHLASAAEHGFREIYSNDRHFLAAAPLFGLCGVNVIK